MNPVDQPALDDDVTARLFELSVQRVQAAGGTLLIPALVGIGAFLWTVSPLMAAIFAPAAPLMVWRAFTQAIPGAWRWPAAARELLGEQPWWGTPVTVLDRRGTVLALPDGEHLRVYGLPAAAREVAVRAGRVWLVGPDAHGWCAVRVDGLYTHPGEAGSRRLDGVPLDVFANAWREEALWVADGAVGFPDYPVVGFARLTRES